jgi:hypothetical protein
MTAVLDGAREGSAKASSTEKPDRYWSAPDRTRTRAKPSDFRFACSNPKSMFLIMAWYGEPSVTGAECGYGCHTTVASRDYIFTAYPPR